ncbi:phage major capsid protein [Sinorhizobium meliloti]|uniref:phage major capsid protein n=1 Tax=Rhizobium meliloti TaxID=382 RepID=UPI003D65DE35
MTNIHHLIEKRNAKFEELRAAQNDDARFTALEAEVASIDGEIRRAQKIDALDKAAASPADANMERELRNYSLAKAIREVQDGKGLTGLEAEMHGELSKGSKEARGIYVPTSVVFGETRASTATAGETIATNLGGLINRLKPALKVQGMGATFLTNLQGNIDFPRMTAGTAAYWVAEDVAPAASDADFDKVSISPNTIGAQTYLTRRITLQNGVALESVLRQDLAYELAKGVDKAAIHGTGVNQPQGILSAITENVTAETDLADIAADLIAALELDDIDGSAGFITNQALLATVRKMRDTTNRLLGVSEIFHGEKVTATNNIDAVAAKNPLIYGAWSNLVVGAWSGIDLRVDPYTSGAKGGIHVYAHMDVDTAIRHPEAFAYKLVA